MAELQALMAPSGELYATLGSLPKPLIPVQFTPVNPENLKLGKGMYIIHLNVSGLTREKAVDVLSKLREGLEQKFGIRTLYAVADSNSIKMVIHGSPFSWLALLAWLPLILGLLGIILFGISVWQAIAAIPSWLWATLIISGALILVGPAIGEWILRQVKKARGERK
jgi:hypothetical protein